MPSPPTPAVIVRPALTFIVREGGSDAPKLGAGIIQGHAGDLIEVGSQRAGTVTAAPYFPDKGELKRGVACGLRLPPECYRIRRYGNRRGLFIGVARILKPPRGFDSCHSLRQVEGKLASCKGFQTPIITFADTICYFFERED